MEKNDESMSNDYLHKTAAAAFCPHSILQTFGHFEKKKICFFYLHMYVCPYLKLTFYRHWTYKYNLYMIRICVKL